MLFTERFHFFNRYAIRGIQKIIFYSPPQFPHFYPEVPPVFPSQLFPFASISFVIDAESDAGRGDIACSLYQV